MNNTTKAILLSSLAVSLGGFFLAVSPHKLKPKVKYEKVSAWVENMTVEGFENSDESTRTIQFFIPAYQDSNDLEVSTKTQGQWQSWHGHYLSIRSKIWDNSAIVNKIWAEVENKTDVNLVYKSVNGGSYILDSVEVLEKR